MTTTTNATHYDRPGWFTQHVFNRAIRGLTGLGVSVWGSRVLQVRGRSSGLVRETVVNLLTTEDGTFLVAPRGHTQWVRNLRVAGAGSLRLGRRTEPFTAVEITGDERATILRRYLERWKFEVGVFFDGVGPDSSDDELLAIADRHPIFELTIDR